MFQVEKVAGHAILAVAVAVGMAGIAAAQTVNISNDNGVPLKIWVERPRAIAFDRPPTYLAPLETKALDASLTGNYYIVMQDYNGHSFPGMTVNLQAQLAQNPTYSLVCSKVYETSGIKVWVWDRWQRKRVEKWIPTQTPTMRLEGRVTAIAPPAPPVIYYYAPVAPPPPPAP